MNNADTPARSGPGVRESAVDDPDIYVDAGTAARLLGVSQPTLYTYVSRKGLRTLRRPNTRKSHYLRADIEALRQGGADAGVKAANAALASATEISLLVDGQVFYRGQSATRLADSASLEDVARLLWQTQGIDPFRRDAPAPAWDAKAFDRWTGHLDPGDRMAVALPLWEALNPRAYDASRDAAIRCGVDALGRCAALELLSQSRAGLALHRSLGDALVCEPAVADLVRQVLVLSADLGFDPATYAVRATANTGASMYRCLVAGLCAASGTRMPSARTNAFKRLVAEVMAARDPCEPIVSRIRDGEAVPGMGFSPFPEPDARAQYLRDAMRAAAGGHAGLAHFTRALDCAHEATGQRPDFALLAAFVGHCLIPQRRINLVRIGRLVGWVAHALEQQFDNPLVVFKTHYKGRLPA